jgi:hypothetical protein
MMDVHDVVAKVESSPEFHEFKTQHPQHYLVHAFATTGPLELGYYNKESDTITVFKSEPVAAMPPEDVFKQSGVLQRLDLARVKIGLQDALALAEKERLVAYPRHATMKTIAVLQQHDAPEWNITLVTATLQMINMKFNATTSELLSRSMQSIMDLARD